MRKRSGGLAWGAASWRLAQICDGSTWKAPRSIIRNRVNRPTTALAHVAVGPLNGVRMASSGMSRHSSVDHEMAGVGR